MNKLLASMSTLINCFAAIAGSIRGKTNGYYNILDIIIDILDIIIDILVKYVYELRRTCPLVKKVKKLKVGQKEK